LTLSGQKFLDIAKLFNELGENEFAIQVGKRVFEATNNFGKAEIPLFKFAINSWLFLGRLYMAENRQAGAYSMFETAHKKCLELLGDVDINTLLARVYENVHRRCVSGHPDILFLHPFTVSCNHHQKVSRKKNFLVGVS